MLLPAIIGAIIGGAVFAFARWQHWDRDRSFYPTVLVVIAQYYVLFAVMDGAKAALLMQITVAISFALVAIVGRHVGGPIIGLAILCHGIYDLAFAWVGGGGGVPGWWPAFCGAVDIVLGMAILLAKPRRAPAQSD